MATVIINEKACKGCGLCVDACPRTVLSLSSHKLNANGYLVAEVTDPERCVACAFCAIMCPDLAISVER